jgi:hypothetical protein
MAALDPNHPPELPEQTSDPGVVRSAKEQAKSLASEAKHQTLRAAGQARDHMQKLVGRQKERAAQRLGTVAEALREAGRKLQDGDGGNSGSAGDGGQSILHLSDRAARQVDRLSGYLRDKELRDFVRDTENFARRRPELFLGGTFLAGLMLARFLKSSAPAGTERGPYAAGYRASRRSSYAPERRNSERSSFATAGTTPYDAPMGV